MDCELCLEEFNQQEHLPKVLGHCGHTFCERCVMHIWENSVIHCPVCRQKVQVQSAKDLPQTNYSLLQVQSQINEEKNLKPMIEKYRVTQNFGSLISEQIQRENYPF